MTTPPTLESKAFDQTVVKSQVTNQKLVSRRREQIIAAAVELFSDQGYYRTTIQDIARKAGVSIGLIYQYAQTKEDVLLLSLMSVLESYQREIPRAVDEDDDPLEALWSSLSTYCRVIDRRRNAAVLAYRSTKSLPREQREIIMQLEVETNEFLAERLRSCIAAGLFRKIDVDLVTYQLVLYAHTWALKHWRLSKLTTIDGYIEHGFDFFVHAMATPAGLVHYGQFLARQQTKAKPVRKPRRRKTLLSKV
ncbi:TetR/AcrR family transcriptional regulator [Mesorhizobium koreense]|jgi:AcrR family transcriptional regulator|uniref:TetR/AcrR family transcriptional regulator n=1 Tax=Mesorhizobium koreense TaxID=3074855 RepID=UPI00287B9832|nr:TetR/AcrR family transcriptional regulator [Mesorhizobium sp. WR6]